MNLSLSNYINRFPKIKVLVVGDAMLDKYFTGRAERICREAPVPIVDITRIQEMPGGAANAAVNLATLGAQTTFMSIVGDDPAGKYLTQCLKNFGIDITYTISSAYAPTMTKNRLIAKNQLLMRFDTGNKIIQKPSLENMFLENLITAYSQVDAVLISDYEYGCITQTTKKILKRLLEKENKIFIVDAKYPEKYADFPATAIKPNYEETERLLAISPTVQFSTRAEKIVSYREDLLKKVQSNIIAVTLDKEGAVLINRGGSYYQTYTSPQPDSKAAGAGDTYASALLLALATGANMTEAAEIAGKAATITVQKSATAFCTIEELQQAIATDTKYIMTTKKLEKILSTLQTQRKKIVFTNGCFDILHPGHINYLQTAKSLGDVLILGINSDASIKRIKGNNRPINTLTDRMHVLSGLSSVDYIIPFEEDTPTSLIEKIQPKVYVKGGDYTKEILPEAKIVEQYGGLVKIIPYILGKSTTHIIEKISSQKGGNNVAV